VTFLLLLLSLFLKLPNVQNPTASSLILQKSQGERMRISGHISLCGAFLELLQ